ncbi:MAG: ABC transporter permease subunit [Treponema sp.]|nr:ABC transporter permease subunit [Treponema sp.]
MTDKDNTQHTIIFCFGIVLLCLCIHIIGWVKHDVLVFPNVISIIKSFFSLLGQRRTYVLIGTTCIHLILAVFFATLIGLALGLAEGFSKTVHTLFEPCMILFRSMPMIVLAVIIMVITHYSWVPVIAATVVLIPLISEASCAGVQSIDKDLVDVYKLNTSFNLHILMSVYIPRMSGYLKQAFAGAIGMGIKIIVSAEYLVQTKNSLGKAVFTSSYFNEYQEIYAYALIIIILVLIIEKLPLLVYRIIDTFSEKKTAFRK